LYYPSAFRASPNDTRIVIFVIIIIIGKAGIELHSDGIIAQSSGGQDFEFPGAPSSYDLDEVSI